MHPKCAVPKEHFPLWSLQCDDVLRQLEPRLVFSVCWTTFYRLCRKKKIFTTSARLASCSERCERSSIFTGRAARGVTGRPIRPPQLEPKPLRSHQLSNTKSPGGSIIDPADPLVVGRRERKKRVFRFTGASRLLACFQQVPNLNSGGF